MIQPCVVRGKKLHVEIFGKTGSPAVLFLHGGPGESSYEFVYHQAEKLVAELFVIAIDQRGVCRSDKILEDEPFGLKDLIDDCENLRRQLGIKQWSVIGHSFGGYLALIYAADHPDSVANVIFECPTFDFKWTALSLLTKAASIFKTLGDAERSEQCLRLTASNLSARELFDRYIQFGEELGEKKELIYSPYETLTDDSLYTEEEWDEFGERTDIHLSRLREEGKIFESAVPLLSRLSVPSLLILGEHDPVTCERHIRAYKEAAQGEIIMMKGCGHTPHKEQPALYRDTVSKFILAKSKTDRGKNHGRAPESLRIGKWGGCQINARCPGALHDYPV